ncbi:MAG: Flp pilus assembly complex ATPase component TadA [Candidatus Omnitrophica bacterium]|nr:Flp pilus assembly complex ATPase component TadA [Candidatus Omnitrophota bacterium]MBU2044386.1 Flp pilus assembly complex ATPase component TadA [Candidatus Omnitrophota bacterium]MBU2251435.1 Flp pilus assembly complex ATPase component TadA [Candidatus Omnitrophota bacterium]MBU2474229.1 Flp pilus assembly complex ATPase component TadA [Candidatus Omnitrophota bacterium]
MPEPTIDPKPQEKENKSRKKLGEILIEQKVVTEDVLRQALSDQKVTRQRLGEILIERGWVRAEDINIALAHQMEIETVSLADYVIDSQILSVIIEEEARKYKLMPLFKAGNVLSVAMANPNDVVAIDQLRRQTSFQIKPLAATESDIFWAIEQYYQSSGTVETVLTGIDIDKLQKGDSKQEMAILKLVNMLITHAVHERISDIHIEPEKNTVNIRYRLDGMLHKQYVLPKVLQGAVTSRIKILANLDISEKRLPQDGRIRMRVEGREIDFRVSTCPTVSGENTVLRVLDKTGLTLGLEGLGFPGRDLERFKKMFTSPYGIILVTGPTGSGKTTTLYSVLQQLNKEDVNVMTVEDPVEYQFHGMRQVNVNSSIGLTFAAALRSFLRQDPDIVMVGEIRDLETAEIAVQAALTGHLVLSTLHTNDAPSAFSRLVEMGVEPFLVSSSLLGVLAQRLVRKVCDKCHEEYSPDETMIKALHLEGKVAPGQKFFRAKIKGCPVCNGTGYKGRVGIYELLDNTPGIQTLVLKRSPANEIRAKALTEGLVSLRDAAMDKFLAGLITAEEVFRVTQEVEI